MNNDKKNVTFSAFFKMALLMLTGSILYVTTIIPAKFGENGLIVSLFFMQFLAFAYVIILYVVYVKISEYEECRVDIRGNNNEKTVIAWIYVTRMAIKSGIMVYIISELARDLVLKKYPLIVTAIPVIAAAAYMGSKGLGGMARFAEAVFWFTQAAAVIVFVASLRNVDPGQLAGYWRMYEEQGVNVTVNRIMSRGGLMFLGFSSMEFVVIEYLRIRNRRREMLAAAVGAASILGIIGSIIVTTTLGLQTLAEGQKGILYIVGAMVLPNGTRIRPLILVCYMMVVWGSMTIIPNIACGCGAIDRCVRSDRSGMVKAVWLLAAYGVMVCIDRLLPDKELYRLIPGYLILVDVPLSIILPAAASIKKIKLRPACVLLLCMGISTVLSACDYKPVEAVDYANVLVVEESQENTDRLKYTLILTELDDDSETVTQETRYTLEASSFDEVCKSYDKSHVRSVDTSHVEYIIVQNGQVLDLAYEELENRFATSYVLVIEDDNIWAGLPERGAKEYLKTHYNGRCLAAIK